jgi:hypothetical protein
MSHSANSFNALTTENEHFIGVSKEKSPEFERQIYPAVFSLVY